MAETILTCSPSRVEILAALSSVARDKLKLLEDIGDLPSDLPSYIEIDWDKTADNLRVDYSEVEYQGTTYLVRD